jgi:hypothetical protein
VFLFHGHVVIPRSMWSWTWMKHGKTKLPNFGVLGTFTFFFLLGPGSGLLLLPPLLIVGASFHSVRVSWKEEDDDKGALQIPSVFLE